MKKPILSLLAVAVLLSGVAGANAAEKRVTASTAVRAKDSAVFKTPLLDYRQLITNRPAPKSTSVKRSALTVAQPGQVSSQFVAPGVWCGVDFYADERVEESCNGDPVRTGWRARAELNPESLFYANGLYTAYFEIYSFGQDSASEYAVDHYNYSYKTPVDFDTDRFGYMTYIPGVEANVGDGTYHAHVIVVDELYGDVICDVESYSYDLW